ncbi:MAG: tRNA (adenosine(37)-N6)-threonylcarbamoyltransferase complex dimerization subunit type 1 TsaB [Deltaproteobacteria bacterium]
MLTLSVDTSTSDGSIALVSGSEILCERSVAGISAHATWLSPAIDAVIKENNLTIGDIGLFAVSRGPGSFTGLRIGVSTVNALAWALKKNVIGISSLLALAMNMKAHGKTLCTVLDAGKNEVYAALYSFSGGTVSQVMGECAVTPAELVRRIEGLGIKGEVLFLGRGIERHAGFFRDGLENAVMAEESLWGIRASNVAYLAQEAFRLKGADSPYGLTPLYIRKSEAELRAGL